MRWSIALLAGSLLLGACAGARGPRPGSDPELQGVPPVTVRSSGDSVQLRPYTYCFAGGCADGIPPADPPNIGSPEEVRVEFPLPGWSFTALFRPAGEECGRVQHARLAPAGEGAFVLLPAGHAGAYDVTLAGKGGGGDLFAVFRWTTPLDGPLATPRARLAVLARHDGGLDSYGVELEVSNLARTPERASATITVRAGSGSALAFDATRTHRGCLPEGTVAWDGPDERGRAAAALGDAPFTYEVELVLDGVRHVATATWPDDEIVGHEPSVPLRFTPELPALS